MPLTQYFTLMDTLARLRLKADARRYFFGYLWWVLEPLLYVAVFYIVFEVLLGSRRPDFLVFLAVGKLTFIWFSKSVTQAAGSLVLNKGVIGQINLPKHLFPIAVLHEGLYRQAAVFVFLIGFISLAGYAPHASWWYLLPIAVVQYCLIIGCGLIAALLVCAKQDFQLLISLGMVFLLFMSGIFWDIRSIEDPLLADWVMTLNPLAVLIDSYRQVLMMGQAPDINRLAITLIEAAVVICVALFSYRRLHYWIAKKALVS